MPRRPSKTKSATSSSSRRAGNPAPGAAGDEAFLREAIAEAAKGSPHPNPAVGAVIVREGRILARGFHSRAGGPHAEIEAIRALRDPREAVGATLYVTLEPCSTHGRTPPCTDAIIRAGFSRVVFGATDPNPAHRSRAARLMQEAGISVESGVLAEACEALNTAWNKWIATGLPFVTIKAGMSLDGRISSPPGRRWITSREARADAMKLRAAHVAILVGGGTVRDDNPRLTLRGLPGGRQPLRVVWTRSGNLPPDSRLLIDGGPTRVFCGGTIRACLRDLGASGIQSVLIEGGGRTLGEVIDRNLADQAVFYIAPVLLGGPVPATAGRGFADPFRSPRLENPEYRQIGPDLRVSGKIRI